MNYRSGPCIQCEIYHFMINGLWDLSLLVLKYSVLLLYYCYTLYLRFTLQLSNSIGSLVNSFTQLSEVYNHNSFAKFVGASFRL